MYAGMSIQLSRTATQTDSVTATRRHRFADDTISVRKATVGLDEIKHACAENGRDEIVVQDPKGDLYVVGADILTTGENRLDAFNGDDFALGSINGKIVHVDKEHSIRPMASVSLLATALLAGGVSAGAAMGSIMGVDLGVMTETARMLVATVGFAAAAAPGMVISQIIDRRIPDTAQLDAVSTPIDPG